MEKWGIITILNIILKRVDKGASLHFNGLLWWVEWALDNGLIKF